MPQKQVLWGGAVNEDFWHTGVIRNVLTDISVNLNTVQLKKSPGRLTFFS